MEKNNLSKMEEIKRINSKTMQQNGLMTTDEARSRTELRTNNYKMEKQERRQFIEESILLKESKRKKCFSV